MSSSFLGWRAEVAAMPDGLAKMLGEAALDGESFTWKMDREHIMEGATFSRIAMDALKLALISFVEARIMTRWDATNEPPSHLEVTIRVVAA